MNQTAFFLFTTIVLFGTAFPAHAQSLRLRTQAPPASATAEESPWQGSLRYGVITDYADTTEPRGYTNSLTGSLGYSFNSNWSLAVEAGARAEFIDGSIDKGSEQGYAEVISASTSLELDYETKLLRKHKFSTFLHAEPLWDEASRLEGYKALAGGGMEVGLNFFHQAYTFGNSVDVTELVNTFKYGSDLTANPDYFVTYRMSHSLRFWGSYKLAWIFGLKTTRYLDGFWGYNYQNSIAVSKTWQQLTVALGYENGGFTDDGTVSLWYIDQYRRLGRLSVNYTF